MSESVTTPKELWGRGIRIPVFGVTGEKWMGKTLLGLSICPEETGVVDLELSSTTYGDIKVKKRWDLYREMIAKYNRPATPLECWLWFQELIRSIKPGEFRVLFVDPISDIEAGLVDWVDQNPEKFGHTRKQYDKAEGLKWGDVKQAWKMELGVLSEKVETFAFSTHMGSIFKDGAPVAGKRKAKGKETLYELASLYLQMERPKSPVNGQHADVPSARVLKSRLAFSNVVDGEIVHTPILPPYLEKATPKAIRHYIANPPDYAKLKTTEMAPSEEGMSDDDRLILQAQIASDNRAAEEARSALRDKSLIAAAQQRQSLQPHTGPKLEAAAPSPGVESKGFDVDLLSDAQGVMDESEKDRLIRECNVLFAKVGATGDDVTRAIQKRNPGATTLKEMALDEIKSLHAALYDRVNE